MEHAWTIQFLLKSGDCVEGTYRGPEDNEYKVAKKIFDEQPKTRFVTCRGRDESGQLYVSRDDVSSFEIFIKKENEK